MMRFLSLFTAVGFLMLSAISSDATKIKSVNLEQMVKEADRIFIGTCVAVEDTTLPGRDLPVTLYTFSVEERIKGPVGKTLTVRQVGVRAPRMGGDQALVWRIPGMPVYQVGQEVVLFLTADSSWGLTSPVGLKQGAFTVEEKDGKKILQNGFQNGGLFQNLSPEKSFKQWGITDKEADLFLTKKGPMDYSTFIAVVKKMVEPL